jgi:hypothetical protein
MNKKLFLRQLCIGVFLTTLTVSAVEKISNTEWTRLKKQAVNRKREIIHNNDGCDAVYFPRKLKATKENFIKQRLINAKNTKVGTYSYCPLSSGFGYLISKTKVGDQLLIDPPHAKNKRNVTGELLKMGTDPVKIAEEFCRENNLEFFISLRCNDTHDQSHRKDKPHFLFPPYKGEHPEFLMGSYTKRPPHCSWSAVDFTHAAVRKRFVAITKELISNYSLDCLELDFCRHLQYFKSVAWGKEASKKELDMMTDCIREIRSFAEKTGRQRRHPILIAVRVPDSAGMCKAVGLDLENWMREGLIDIVIGGFYMQLNPWKKTVDLCHKYGVKFYPSMDESRIRNVAKGFNRNTYTTDRARVAAALNAGADGIYFFNRYGSRQLGNMRGKLDDIRLKNKSYFVTYRYQSPSSYLSTGGRYKNIKNLSPVTPGFLIPGTRTDYYLDFGDDMNHPDVKQAEPTITVSAITARNSGSRLKIYVNDAPLKQVKSSDKLTIYSAPVKRFKPGLNKITVRVLPAANALKFEKMIMGGDKLLKGRSQFPWRRLFVVHDFPRSEKIIDGAYRISDTGTKKSEMANLLYPLGGVGEELNVRFQAKVERASDNLSVVFRIADGKNIEIVTLQPDKIGLCFTGKSVPFKTTDAFHNYEAIMKNGNFILKVDGKELFNTPVTMKADNPAGHLKNSAYRIANMDRQSLLFGSLSGPGTGAALWKNVRVVETNDRLQLKDLKFDVIFPKAKHLNKYRAVSPDWKFKFNVADGIVPTSKYIKNSYKKQNISVVKGENGAKALQLNHLTGHQAIMIKNQALMAKGSGVMLAEWKIKYLQGVGGQSGFYVVFKVMNPKQQGLLCNLQFFSNKIIAPWGTIALNQSIKNRWETFRIAIDVKTHIALLWLNGKKIGEGNIPIRRKMAPGIFFGDGSGAVDGQAELEYLNITTLN